MPLHPDDITKFLSNPSNDKDNSELLQLLIKRMNELCFNECQVDRVACTLTPRCTRRYMIRLRIKNGLKIDELPKFCYSVHKGVVERDFRGKTVVYRPYDSFLYIIDFLDVFFHGDYRRLTKFITFKKWEEAKEIFNRRILYENENFEYNLTENKNYMIFLFEDRLHVIYINEGYAVCNMNRENITNLELLKGICDLYAKIYFPEVKIRLKSSKYVKIVMRLTRDIIFSISNDPSLIKGSKLNEYFWNIFSEDLNALMDYCTHIRLEFDEILNMEIRLYINVKSNNYSEDRGSKMPLRFRDLRLLLNFLNRVYNDFFVIYL